MSTSPRWRSPGVSLFRHCGVVFVMELAPASVCGREALEGVVEPEAVLGLGEAAAEETRSVAVMLAVRPGQSDAEARRTPRPEPPAPADGLGNGLASSGPGAGREEKQQPATTTFFTKWGGVEGAVPPKDPPSLRHSLMSFAQATISITLLAFFDSAFGLEGDLVFLIASFAATAVLIHSAVGSPLAQPRNVILGHLVSAFVGVSVYKLVGRKEPWACGLAVGFAIVVMERLRCLHPPGGATALVAVAGGDRVHSMGYLFVIFPCFIGPLVMLAVALIMNNADIRQYPLYWDFPIVKSIRLGATEAVRTCWRRKLGGHVDESAEHQPQQQLPV